MSSTLRCPISGASLELSERVEWPAAGRATPVGRGAFTPIGLTEQLLVTTDGRIAYPIVDGIPVLMSTEAFSAVESTARSVEHPRYAEAYQEMQLYNARARDQRQPGLDADLARLKALAGLSDADRGAFPDPPERWLGPGSTITAQHRCYSFLRPLEGQRVLQIGGWGSHALLLLRAGASTATVVSPMIDELQLGRDVARAAGLEDRLVTVAGLAEELPLADASIDRIFSGSSLHHTRTEESFSEAARVLSPTGRAASIDVWRAPLYDLGTKIFGKSGGNAFCHPFDAERIAPSHQSFGRVEPAFHGALARYPLAVLARVGRSAGLGMSWKLARSEDRLAARVPVLAKQSSLVSLCLSEPHPETRRDLRGTIELR